MEGIINLIKVIFKTPVLVIFILFGILEFIFSRKKGR